MMKALSAAKINLYLEVKCRRPDGYHEIETLYQPVSLWDELTFEPAHSGIEVTGDDPLIPWNEENLCHRAARLVFEKAGFRGGLKMTVRKGIPSGAGLGGGSSDAAASLVAVNKLFDFGLTRAELLDMGAALGSDVPFFVGGKPAIGRGRGEILEDVAGLPGGWVLIVKPDVTISTKWAYESLTLLLTRAGGKTRLSELMEGLRRFPDIRLDTHNSFEAGVIERFPSIAGVLRTLREAKPVMSSLSGSGSACFAIFEGEREAREVGERFESEGFFSRVVKPVGRTIQFG
jgi:4-diphosphocytidyl-2-C-methyl-D-erythritol kinase